MTPRDEIKKAVLAQIIEVMDQADKAGVDTWQAAERAFPGTPTDVIAEAWVEFDNAKTEAWWRQVEQTIDGEVVKRAMLATGGEA